MHNDDDEEEVGAATGKSKREIDGDDAEGKREEMNVTGLCLGQGTMDLRALAPPKRIPNCVIADCGSRNSQLEPSSDV